MIVERIVADVFSENCYVLAAGEGAPAVVVDPGAGTADAVLAVRESHGLSLGCVLLTHGHPDHVWDAAAVAGDAPVYVSAPDRYRLKDPLGSSTAVTMALFAGPWQCPVDVRELPAEHFAGEGAPLVPGITIRSLPAPGHTEGSTIHFLHARWPAAVASWVGEDDTAEPWPLALTGDVVFRGSIGRVDLPGGDADVMAWTLRTLKQVVDPRTWLLPGHGPGSTMSTELLTNPFLAARR